MLVENGARFSVDVVQGQKTGFFLDQVGGGGPVRWEGRRTGEGGYSATRTCFPSHIVTLV